MPLKLNYQYKDYKDTEIMISGYPKEKNIKGKFVQYYEKNTAVYQK